MSNCINERLAEFGKAENLLNKLIDTIFKEDSGNIFALDILIMSAVSRSLALLSGFKLLIEERNFISAAPLLRLQIDNSLRLFAISLVNEPEKIAKKVLEGEEIRKMKDSKGTKMTDRYLVDELSKLYPWIKNVYRQTSGYIHLSEKHFYTSIESIEREAVISFCIGKGGAMGVSEEIYLEAIDAFLEATRVFASLVGSWANQKTAIGRHRRANPTSGNGSEYGGTTNPNKSGLKEF
jgi:hypothetical protein